MTISENTFLPEPISYIFDQLEKSNIFYWIDAGTLLKGVRDKTILESSDIDISIHSAQVKDVLNALTCIEERGYKVQYNGGNLMLEDLITISLPFSVNKITSIDIYIYHEKKSFFIRRSYHKPLKDSYFKYLFYLSKKISKCDKGKSSEKCKIRFIFSRFIFYFYELFGKTMWWMIPRQYFSDFSTLKIHSRVFRVPKLYKEYLCFRYGDNWSVPIERSEWFQDWNAGESKILVSRRLFTLFSIKKYWIN
jgi:phosphorylcholine metabolism protein LicD